MRIKCTQSAFQKTAVEEEGLVALCHRDPQILGCTLSEALNTEKISFRFPRIRIASKRPLFGYALSFEISSICIYML